MAKQMIKRADGSTSQAGLWDNIRNKAKQNKASGAKPKKPSSAMLKQEKKIKTMKSGGKISCWTGYKKEGKKMKGGKKVNNCVKK